MHVKEPLALSPAPAKVAQRIAESKAYEAANHLPYGSGSFIDAARQHARDFVYFYTEPLSLWANLGFYVQMMTTMLIGHRQWYRRIAELMPLNRRLQWWALGIGLACLPPSTPVPSTA